MTPGEAFFQPWETMVANWAQAQDGINKIIGLASGSKPRNLVWRGVHDATYPLHSSLYRRIFVKTGTPPEEKDVVSFEQKLLKRCRENWRFDNLNALEMLAQIQQHGGPTRLLDVTFNPLIALWFAVEQKYDEYGTPQKDLDGRIFAFDVTNRQIELDDTWGKRDLPWTTAPHANWRRGLPNLWRPPSYNERIPAQNAAFLVGGVPLVGRGDNARYYRKGPGDGTSRGTWSKVDVGRSISVTVKMNSLHRKLRDKATPTFTLRIAGNKKQEIRTVLERNFGYNSSSLYPDLFGLATYGANEIV
jgi:hypothetical protein